MLSHERKSVEVDSYSHAFHVDRSENHSWILYDYKKLKISIKILLSYYDSLNSLTNMPHE